MNTIKEMSEKVQKQLQKLRTGNTIKVYFKIQEGEKSRIQIFEGIIISKHREKSPDATITVRRVTGGYGVERIFPIHSPLIEKIEIIKIATNIKQAKIGYLRDRKGKKARLKENVLNERLNIILKEEKEKKESIDKEDKQENTEGEKKE